MYVQTIKGDIMSAGQAATALDVTRQRVLQLLNEPDPAKPHLVGQRVGARIIVVSAASVERYRTYRTNRDAATASTAWA